MNDRGTGRTTRQLLSILRAIPSEKNQLIIYATHNMGFARHCFGMFIELAHYNNSLKHFKVNKSSLSLRHENGVVVKFTETKKVSDDDGERCEMARGYRGYSIISDHAAYWI